MHIMFQDKKMSSSVSFNLLQKIILDSCATWVNLSSKYDEKIIKYLPTQFDEEENANNQNLWRMALILALNFFF